MKKCIENYLYKLSKILRRDWYQRKYRSFLKKYFPKKYRFLFAKDYYYYSTGKKLDYHQPRDINEKLFWLSYYWQHPLIVRCSDKFEVREYIKECLLEHILVPLYGVYKNAHSIDFEILPNQFVLKCNHGSGTNIICKDKTRLSIQQTLNSLNTWMNQDYGLDTAEYQYSKIQKRIICEKYLENSGHVSLIDYKIHCINGVPQFFLIVSERDAIKGEMTLSSYSLNWNRLTLLKREEDNLNYTIAAPKCLDKMVEYARILSKPFPYVRVDMYEVEGKVYFGELTFTPATNIMYYYKQSTLDMMGRKLILPKKYDQFS